MLSACADAPPQLPTPTATLRPRTESTPSITPSVVLLGEPLETPGATPTPFAHVIQEGDTLLGIAIQYGIDLADLLLANPGVNPRFLSVGEELIVPLAGAQGPVPSATPFPLTLSPVNCFGETSGPFWCLLTASVASDTPVEGVVALVTLFDSEGTALQTEPAYSPVNLLVPDGVLPLVAYFDPPVPEHVAASAMAISALIAGDVEARYPALQVTLETEAYSADGRVVSVSGIVRLANGQVPAESEVRIVAMALDESGLLLGYRVMESAQVAGLQNGLSFALEIHSSGPEITEVIVLAEAR
jgi:LysM repeat protein